MQRKLSVRCDASHDEARDREKNILFEGHPHGHYKRKVGPEVVI